MAFVPHDLSFFAPDSPLFSARAPGRLDVMGGISDYSGGLCLEWPLACATHCHTQINASGKLEAHSLDAARHGWISPVSVDAAAFLQTPPNEIAARFFPSSAHRWAAYVLGAFAVLYAHHPASRARLVDNFGACLQVNSDVPLGAGVSSSASLEVAVMTALNRALSLNLNGETAARLCQRVENDVAGAPCGIMDQMTVAIGRPNHLLRLLCQPAIVEGFVALPTEIEVWGIDSGATHSVGGGEYGRARAAAMMGRRILKDKVPQAMKGPDDESYLSNLSVDAWRALRQSLPETMNGRDFITQFGTHGDAATTIENEQDYRVRLATEHPIYEIDRVRRFARLLEDANANPNARTEFLRAAGELMIQSHFSYAHRCDLGSPAVDLLVKLARQRGVASGIYGAKITGGGLGGTVALLCDRRLNANLEATLNSIGDEYVNASGHNWRLLGGSSAGAFDG